MLFGCEAVLVLVLVGWALVGCGDLEARPEKPERRPAPRVVDQDCTIPDAGRIPDSMVWAAEQARQTCLLIHAVDRLTFAIDTLPRPVAR